MANDFIFVVNMTTSVSSDDDDVRYINNALDALGANGPSVAVFNTRSDAKCFVKDIIDDIFYCANVNWHPDRRLIDPVDDPVVQDACGFGYGAFSPCVTITRDDQAEFKFWIHRVEL